jgi:chorismate synthase
VCSSDLAGINAQLKRRQAGFGRGKRMQIENDTAEIISGLKAGVSLGSPIALLIRNKDYKIDSLHKEISPRPGHADLPGLLKYGFSDIREVLERASARSTAATVAIGAVCRILLQEFGIKITSRVLSVGAESSPSAIVAKIKEAIANKDTIGGIFEVVAKGVPAGLGSYVQPDRRLDGKLAQNIIAIPGIKAFEVGLGIGYGVSFGSEVHDAIFYKKEKGYFHKTNNAGGIEGGVSNGEDIILRACMKPIATLMSPLESVNINSKKISSAATERSDTCVVEAAGVVAEAACAYVLAEALLEKFGQDSLKDISKAYKDYLGRIK